MGPKANNLFLITLVGFVYHKGYFAVREADVRASLVSPEAGTN